MKVCLTKYGLKANDRARIGLVAEKKNQKNLDKREKRRS